MGFESGYIARNEVDASEWKIQDAHGKELDVNDVRPTQLERGTVLEFQSPFFGRLRLASGNYLVGYVTDTDIEDVAGLYAQEKISEISKQKDTEAVPEAFVGWIRHGQTFWWTNNAPPPFQNGQRVRASKLQVSLEPEVDPWPAHIPIGNINVNDLDFERSEQLQRERWSAAESVTDMTLEWIGDEQIFWWKKNAPPPFKDGQRVRATGLWVGVESVAGGKQADIRIGRINVGDLDFEDSEQDRQKRRGELDEGVGLALMSPKEAMDLLATVDVIAQHLPAQTTAVIELAASDDAFNERALEHVQGAPVQPEDVNGFTSRKGDPITIVLRPGAQGVGTEAHEMLHALSAPSLSDKIQFFFGEGITEYLTRMATKRRFAPRKAYPDEYDYFHKLVEIGATDPRTLAKLYFTGDWEGFEQRLRDYAGQWVSVQHVITATRETSMAILKYLKHLAANKQAPLRSFGY